MSGSASGEHFEALIAGLASSGRSASAGDVLRDGLHPLGHREKLRESEPDARRADIREGLDGGPAEPLDLDASRPMRLFGFDGTADGTPG